MIVKNECPELSMGQKLKMFREINQLSQEQLGNQLNVTDKTISAWENEEREINLSNAQIIANLFNIPKEYFVFNENFEKIDRSLSIKIDNYLKQQEYNNKINQILLNCKNKIEKDCLPMKKEYLPVFDFNKQIFVSFGLFDKKYLPIEQQHAGLGTNNTYRKNYYNIKNVNLDDKQLYQYSSKELAQYNLLDVLEKFNSEKVEIIDLINCNNLSLFRNTLINMRGKKYTQKNNYNPYAEGRDISTEYIQNQLNNVLEELNPSLSHFWEIIIFLIDNGAFYEKQNGYGDDITCFNNIKDISKTNLVYRMAKDNISK